MAQPILTSDGIAAVKKEISNIENVEIARTQKRLLEAKKYGDPVAIEDAKEKHRFYQERLPIIKEWVRSNIKRVNSSPIYEGRTEPEQILTDKIKLWKEMIEKEKSDLEVFQNFETHIVPVALLIAWKESTLADEIEKHEKELSGFIDDAKWLSC